jgi:hypothetical protein
MPRSVPHGLPGARAVLVVAHPSHELRVHGWLQIARPRVLVLTDGSGRSGEPRLAATTAVVAEVGATPGGLYGRISDLDLYAAILRRDVPLFVELVERIAEDLEEAGADYVVCDADEGYSSAHDLCAMLVDAATALLQSRDGRSVLRYDFLVVGAPEPFTAGSNGDDVWIHLDDAMFLRKVYAARGYHPKLAAEIEAAMQGASLHGARRFSEPEIAGQLDVEVVDRVLRALESRPELNAKVQQVLGGVAIEAFRSECLRPLRRRAGEEAPFYELYGEQLVAAGRYTQVIRFRGHILPIVEALRRHVGASRRERA